MWWFTLINTNYSPSTRWHWLLTPTANWQYWLSPNNVVKVQIISTLTPILSSNPNPKPCGGQRADVNTAFTSTLYLYTRWTKTSNLSQEGRHRMNWWDWGLDKLKKMNIWILLQKMSVLTEAVKLVGKRCFVLMFESWQRLVYLFYSFWFPYERGRLLGCSLWGVFTCDLLAKRQASCLLAKTLHISTVMRVSVQGPFS